MDAVLINAAVRLAAVLAQENAALAALDLAGATRVLAEKERAADAFLAARALATPPAAGGPVDTSAARDVAERLTDLARENRRLLERAIAVQGRVIGVLARAAQPRPTRYAANGAARTGGGTVAVALTARA